MTEHGERKSGTAVADDDVEAMADEAEAGYNLEAVRRRAGRLAMGFASASVESVRLDPELESDLILRAAQDCIGVCDPIRHADRRCLHGS